MKMNIKISLTVIIISFTLFVFFLSLGQKSQYDTSDLIGKKIDSFNLMLLDEKKNITEIDLINNEYTLINFWASWCAPCRIEHPVLIKLSEEKNLRIVGVNFKDKKKQAKKFLDELGNPYYVSTKDTNGKQSVLFGIYGIPESILINKELIVIKKFVGPLSVNDFNYIKEIIN